ncbi:MAG TPA: hypothetical protein VN861_15130 [Candidatus Acidoferrales bacterium]|nr:hypothetical protein [Candidatus Acidoferrales bacterium]
MMRIIRRFVLLAAFVPISLGWGSSAEPPVDVSIINLIATPEKFDGKLVSVIGFIHIGREQDLLFLGEADFNHGLYQNAVWFHLSEQMGAEREKLNKNYVGIVGVFSIRHEGPSGCPNGGFSSIKRYRVWSTPKNPVGQALDQPGPH